MITGQELQGAMQELNSYEDTLKWFRANLENLKGKFKEQFVVVKDRKVEFSTPNIDEIEKLAESKHLDLSVCLVEFVSEKDVTYII